MNLFKIILSWLITASLIGSVIYLMHSKYLYSLNACVDITASLFVGFGVMFVVSLNLTFKK